MFNATYIRDHLQIIHPHKSSNIKKLNHLYNTTGDNFPKMRLLNFLFELFIGNISINKNDSFYINDEMIYFINNKQAFKYERNNNNNLILIYLILASYVRKVYFKGDDKIFVHPIYLKEGKLDNMSMLLWCIGTIILKYLHNMSTQKIESFHRNFFKFDTFHYFRDSYFSLSESKFFTLCFVFTESRFTEFYIR
jgi:hypothetical protein